MPMEKKQTYEWRCRSWIRRAGSRRWTAVGARNCPGQSLRTCCLPDRDCTTPNNSQLHSNTRQRCRVAITDVKTAQRGILAYHILVYFPDRPDLSYNLKRRPHCNKSLITKTVDLSNNDYIIRATYKNSYGNYSRPKLFYHCIFICFTYLYFHFFLICIMVAFVNLLINERWWWWWPWTEINVRWRTRATCTLVVYTYLVSVIPLCFPFLYFLFFL